MESDRLIELVEGEGLLTREGIARFFETKSDQKIRALSDRLHAALQDSKRSPGNFQPTIFNYIASSSIRTESGCVDPDCRADRIAELARFSLLYAEKVLLPLGTCNSDPLILRGHLMVLSELRPLLDAGIVVPISRELSFCSEHKREFDAARAYVKGIIEPAEDRLADEAIVTRIKAPRAPAGQPPHPLMDKICAYRVDWPAGFEADPINAIVANPELARRMRESTTPDQRIPIELVRELRLLARYVDSPAWDYILHGALNSAADWTYLSNSVLETQVFRSLIKSGEAEESRNRALSEMAHQIPLFADVSLETLLRVRREEGDLFSTYRSALNDALTQAARAGGTSSSSREIYRDLVAPKVSALELRERTLRKRFGKNVLLGYLPSAATVAMGMFATMESTGAGQMIGKLIEAFGLGSLCTQVAQHGTSADSVRTDPFYFLLKLKRSHERECCN